MTVAIEIDLRNDLLPARDQGNRGTCLVHATSSAHEHARKKKEYLSVEHLYFSSRSTAANRSEGCTVLEARNALKNIGQPLEIDAPYNVKITNAIEKGKCFRRDSEQSDVKIEDIVDCLKSGVAPVITFHIPDKFFHPAQPWIIPSDGAIRGVHAVLAVGVGRYNGDPLILIRNSWGSGWGEAGHGWLNRKFISSHIIESFTVTKGLP